MNILSLDLSAYVEIRDDIAYVRGRRLPVVFVASAACENDVSVDELAYQFTLTKEQVLAILLYYHEHQAEIDAQDQIEAEESRRMHERYGGLPTQP